MTPSAFWQGRQDFPVHYAVHFTLDQRICYLHSPALWLAHRYLPFVNTPPHPLLKQLLLARMFRSHPGGLPCQPANADNYHPELMNSWYHTIYPGSASVSNVLLNRTAVTITFTRSKLFPVVMHFLDIPKQEENNTFCHTNLLGTFCSGRIYP